MLKKIGRREVGKQRPPSCDSGKRVRLLSGMGWVEAPKEGRVCEQPKALSASSPHQPMTQSTDCPKHMELREQGKERGTKRKRGLQCEGIMCHAKDFGFYPLGSHKMFKQRK